MFDHTNAFANSFFFTKGLIAESHVEEKMSLKSIGNFGQRLIELKSLPVKPSLSKGVTDLTKQVCIFVEIRDINIVIRMEETEVMLLN